MGKFRKLPVEIEAIQWDGWNETFDKIKILCGKRKVLITKDADKIEIETLEGNHLANVGDYIIRGVKGGCYPCKSDIFKMTYEEVV